MTQATTPTITLHFKSKTVDFEQIEQFWITIKQTDKRVVTRTDPIIDPDKKNISVTLTQTECNVFKEGEAEVQVRGKYKDGNVFATKVRRIPINRALYKEVV